MPGYLSDYGSEYANETGAPSGLVESLGHLPSGYAMMGWNSIRGSRTILKGGFDETGFFHRKASIGRWLSGNQEKKTFRNSLRGSNPLGPRSWTKFGSQGMLHEDPTSPLDILARGGNWIGGKALGVAGNRGGGMAERLASKGISNKDGSEFFSRGFMARMQASQKIAKGNLSGKKLMSVDRFIQGDKGFASLATDMGTDLSMTDMSHLTMASMKGTASQYLGGYLRTAASGAPSAESKTMLEAAGKKAYLSGSERALTSMSKLGIEKAEGYGFRAATEAAAEKFGVGVGEKVGSSLLLRGGAEGAALFGGEAVAAVIPGVNIVLAAMMAYDFTKMGVSLMKGGVQTLAEAGKSFKGSIEKGVMGMGYRDTTVAATSRQRGVMAIQASRLNARSVLGSEASYMAAHFG